MKTLGLLALIALQLFLAAYAAHAAPPRPLPELSLTSLQMGIVPASEFAPASRWLLVYLAGDEKADAKLVDALKAFAGAPNADRVVVAVAGASLPALQDYQLRQESLAFVQLFADTDLSAAKALELAGYNTILGIDGTKIEWSVSGAGHDPAALRSLLVDWVK